MGHRPVGRHPMNQTFRRAGILFSNTLLEENEKRAIRDLVAVHPQEFSTDLTMFDRLVRMQHFGLPTRLMDVSLNPLVALYFASDIGPPGTPTDGVVTGFSVPSGREKYYDSDSVSCLANLANLTKTEKNKIIQIRSDRTPGSSTKDEIARINKTHVYRRLHQFIRDEKSYFLPAISPVDLFKPYYVHPKLSNRRISAQSGGFIIFGLQPHRKINFEYKIDETRFVVPHAAKEGIRKSLEILGISDSSLFPEIDREAKRIEASYRGSD